MDLDLIGYLLGVLDAEDRRRTEVALRRDPSTRRRLERLRAALAPLEDLRGADALPPGLAERTVAYVLAHCGTPAAGGPPTPARRAIVPGDRPVFHPSRWRWADALVAACVLVMLGGLGVAGLARQKQRHEIAACQNNLRQIGYGLTDYSDKHAGQFPQVRDQPPFNVAGSFVVLLNEAGSLPAGVPDCPAVVLAQPGAQPPVGYAYTLGYRDEQGGLHGLRRNLLPEGSDMLPILADRMMPVSHQTGHNVLFIGGNVRFCTSPNVGVDGDDIFVNQASKVAAGLHRLDTVLGARDSYP